MKHLKAATAKHIDFFGGIVNENSDEQSENENGFTANGDMA